MREGRTKQERVRTSTKTLLEHKASELLVVRCSCLEVKLRTHRMKKEMEADEMSVELESP